MLEDDPLKLLHRVQMTMLSLKEKLKIELLYFSCTIHMIALDLQLLSPLTLRKQRKSQTTIIPEKPKPSPNMNEALTQERKKEQKGQKKHENCLLEAGSNWRDPTRQSEIAHITTIVIWLKLKNAPRVEET